MSWIVSVDNKPDDGTRWDTEQAAQAHVAELKRQGVVRVVAWEIGEEAS